MTNIYGVKVSPQAKHGLIILALALVLWGSVTVAVLIALENLKAVAISAFVVIPALYVAGKTWNWIDKYRRDEHGEE